jgi:hypothetical protein
MKILLRTSATLLALIASQCGAEDAIETEVVLWGDDADLAKWLGRKGIAARPFAPGTQSSREVILVGNRAAPNEAAAFRELARHIARGSHAIFLCPAVFKKGDNAVGWLPLVNKGTLAPMNVWLYHKDDWAKNHPIFDGLPTGGVLEHAFFREVLPGGWPPGFWGNTPNAVWSGQDAPAEVVAGSIDTSLGYNSGLTVAVHKLGAGRFTLSTLRIRENFDKDPVAERLGRNMLRHAASDMNRPLADLPNDFESQLKAMGY